MQTKRENKSLFNIYFVLIWIVTFMIQTTQNVNNYASIPFAESLGMSTTLAGFFAIPYMVGAVFGRISSGYICDFMSRRKAMMMGSVFFLLGCVMLFFPFCANAPCIMIARTFHGIGFACTTTAVTVASVDVSPPKAAAMAMGFNWTGQALAQASSGYIVDLFVNGSNYLPLFIVTAVIALISLSSAAVCRYHFVPSLPAGGRPSFWGEFSPKKLLEKGAVPMSLVSGVFFLGLSFASFYTVSIALSKGFNVSGYYIFSACSMFFSNIVLTKLGTRFGTRAIVIPAYLFGALGMYIMSTTQSSLMFSLCGMTYGISLGTMPLLQDEMVKCVPFESRGKGASTMFVGQDIAMGIGTFIWGGLIDVFGFFRSSLVSAAIIIAAAVMLAAFLSKRFKASP